MPRPAHGALDGSSVSSTCPEGPPSPARARSRAQIRGWRQVAAARVSRVGRGESKKRLGTMAIAGSYNHKGRFPRGANSPSSPRSRSPRGVGKGPAGLVHLFARTRRTPAPIGTSVAPCAGSPEPVGRTGSGRFDGRVARGLGSRAETSVVRQHGEGKVETKGVGSVRAIAPDLDTILGQRAGSWLAQTIPARYRRPRGLSAAPVLACRSPAGRPPPRVLPRKMCVPWVRRSIAPWTDP